MLTKKHILVQQIETLCWPVSVLKSGISKILKKWQNLEDLRILVLLRSAKFHF
jgi:hypothetical protein